MHFPTHRRKCTLMLRRVIQRLTPLLGADGWRKNMNPWPIHCRSCVPLEGRVNANQYQVVLSDHLFPVMTHFCPHGYENDLYSQPDLHSQTQLNTCGLVSQTSLSNHHVQNPKYRNIVFQEWFSIHVLEFQRLSESIPRNCSGSTWWSNDSWGHFMMPFSIICM